MIRSKILFCLALLFQLSSIRAQQVTTFEARYFSKNPEANGVTDLHGETEVFDIDQRVDFLNTYAAYASKFWGDPGLDKPLFSDSDVAGWLSRIKPQPLTSVRRTIRLEDWRACGYKKGKEADVAARWKAWISAGAGIENGRLVLDGTSASVDIKPLDWRFRMKVSLAEPPVGLHVILSSSDVILSDS